MGKIYTYKNPNNLVKHPCFDEIKNSIHICAASSTFRGIMDSEYSNLLKGPIISIGSILKNLLIDWESETIKLGQLTEVRRNLREMIEDVNNKEIKNLLTGMKRNRKDILDSIRLLTENNVFPDQFNPQSLEEEQFKLLWEKVGKHKSFLRFRNKYHRNFDNKDEFINAFKSALIKGIDKLIDKEIDNRNGEKPLESKKIVLYKKYKSIVEDDFPKLKIVLHGFYFIQPLQDRLFKLMEKHGLELIFLNCYDENYSKIFSIWEKTFSEDFGFPPKKEWIGIPGENVDMSWGTVFGKIYEGGDYRFITPSNILNITQFTDIPSYIEDYSVDEELNGENHKVSYFSPESDKLNRILREYFPNKFGERHFLSYPIGQFLAYIHKMWDEDSNGLILDLNGLKTCFSSGWLYDNKKDSRDYLHVLHRIAPYFEDCKTISEWEERLELLNNIRENIVNTFDYNGTCSLEKKRFHKMISNPFLKLSYFREEKENLDTVTRLIRKLIKIAENLFNDNKAISLSGHFNKIYILVEEHLDSVELLEEEKELVKELKERLTLTNNDFEYCFPEDISDALSYFLGGQFSDDEDPFKQVIYKFTQLEGSSFSQRIEKVHACHLSEESMPGSESSLTWPLTEANLSCLNDNDLVKRSLLIAKEAKSIYCYLFYSLLAFNKNIKLSWIRNWDHKELNSSVYIQLIEMCRKDIAVDKKLFKWDDVDNDNKVIIPQTKSLKMHEIMKLPDEARMEFDICPRRFFYSYVAQDFPSYSSDYHCRWVFSGLLKSFANVSDRKIDDVFVEMSPLFPQWNSLMKKQTRELTKKEPINITCDSYDGIYYTSERLWPHFLNPKLLTNMKNRFLSDGCELDESIASQYFFKAVSDNDYCMYCPHIEYCKDAINYKDAK